METKIEEINKFKITLTINKKELQDFKIEITKLLGDVCESLIADYPCTNALFCILEEKLRDLI